MCKGKVSLYYVIQYSPNTHTAFAFVLGAFSNIKKKFKSLSNANNELNHSFRIIKKDGRQWVTLLQWRAVRASSTSGYTRTSPTPAIVRSFLDN